MLRVIMLSACTLMLAACATVVRGTSEQVQFNSDPARAVVSSVIVYPCGGPCPQSEQKFDSAAPQPRTDIKTPPVPGPSCITPCLAQVDRNKPLIVTFTKEGYWPQKVHVRTKISNNGTAGVAGNLILGGAVGLATDTITGAGLDHCPNPVIVHLVPMEKNAAPPPEQIIDPCA